LKAISITVPGWPVVTVQKECPAFVLRALTSTRLLSGDLVASDERVHVVVPKDDWLFIFRSGFLDAWMPLEKLVFWDDHKDDHNCPVGALTGLADAFIRHDFRKPGGCLELRVRHLTDKESFHLHLLGIQRREYTEEAVNYSRVLMALKISVVTLEGKLWSADVRVVRTPRRGKVYREYIILSEKEEPLPPLWASEIEAVRRSWLADRQNTTVGRPGGQRPSGRPCERAV
jgi:hypothetical protein